MSESTEELVSKARTWCGDRELPVFEPNWEPQSFEEVVTELGVLVARVGVDTELTDDFMRLAAFEMRMDDGEREHRDIAVLGMVKEFMKRANRDAKKQHEGRRFHRFGHRPPDVFWVFCSAEEKRELDIAMNGFDTRTSMVMIGGLLVQLLGILLTVVAAVLEPAPALLVAAVLLAGLVIVPQVVKPSADAKPGGVRDWILNAVTVVGMGALGFSAYTTRHTLTVVAAVFMVGGTLSFVLGRQRHQARMRAEPTPAA